jgi:hypothetical protein
MPLPDDIREFIPGTVHDDDSEGPGYWIKDGKVMFRHWPLRGAHVPTFRYYLGSFGKDHKHCYCTSTSLKDGNGATFRALNYCYATDGRYVWAIGGRVEGADAEAFTVCDDGSYSLGRGARAPYGYGKDRNRVFYYNYDGKPNWVRKASPETFVSLNDGHFARDANFVFCGAATLPKANVELWNKISGYYSKDDRRIYYFNRPMAQADYDSFEVVPTKRIQLAKDKTHYYNNDRVISAEEFSTQVTEYSTPL